MTYHLTPKSLHFLSMKENLRLPKEHKGALWFYDRRLYPIHAHQHDELECNLVVRGSGIYLINGQKVEIAPNSILWLFPGQIHILLEQSQDFVMWILLIKLDYLKQICLDEQTSVLLQSNPPGKFCRFVSDLQAKKLWQRCQEIALVEDQFSFFNAGLGYILLSAWSAYQQANILPLGKNVHPSVEKAVRLIHDGLINDDLDTLAQKVGLSPHRLSRLFKQQTDVSLTDFRNRCRLERFFELYQNKRNRTILDVAMQAGFGSYAQFYRVFKKTTGITPATYCRDLEHIEVSESNGSMGC